MGEYDNMTKEELMDVFDTKLQQIKEIIDQKYLDGYMKGVNNTAKEFQYELKKSYDEGLRDAWECAKKIANREDEMRETFHDIAPAEIFTKHSASEAIQKINDHEKRQRCQVCDKTRDPIFYGYCNGICDYEISEQDDTIKVGDEIINSCGIKMIVVEVEGYLYRGLTYNRFMCGELSSAKKTGRSFPQLVEILSKEG